MPCEAFKLGRIACLILFVGFNVTFFTQFVMQ